MVRRVRRDRVPAQRPGRRGERRLGLCRGGEPDAAAQLVAQGGVPGPRRRHRHPRIRQSAGCLQQLAGAGVQDHGGFLMRWGTTILALAIASAAWAEEPSALESLNLEAHGFVSFGYLKTWENNWLAADTIDGTDEFYEAALNVVARPWERLRLGAQLFVRDLGAYDNGAVQLDWAYADVSFHDLLDVQAGRVKIPIGLYNENQDLDVATTQVFL